MCAALAPSLVGVGALGPDLAYAESAGCPAAGAATHGPTVYYVSPAGNDGNSGTSPWEPWQTVSRVECAGLRPGDTVAFKGGANFAGALAPYSDESGTGAQPITFTSYGAGQATLADGVYLNSVRFLVFSDLTISNPRAAGLFSSKGGTGVTNVVVRDCTVARTLSYGIASTSSSDASWTIRNSTIEDTGDSGIFSLGGGLTVSANTISSAGTNAAISWPKHGIYAKGPKATILDNAISDSQTSGISLRYQNDLVRSNTITGGKKGIDFNSETDIAGTTYVLRNTVSGTSDTGISVSIGARPLHESLVIGSNHVSNAGVFAVYFVSGAPSLRLSDNLFETIGQRPYLNLPWPMLYTSKSFRDDHDRWYGSHSPTPYYVGGSGHSFAAYSRIFATRVSIAARPLARRSSR